MRLDEARRAFGGTQAESAVGGRYCVTCGALCGLRSGVSEGAASSAGGVDSSFGNSEKPFINCTCVGSNVVSQPPPSATIKLTLARKRFCRTASAVSSSAEQVRLRRHDGGEVDNAGAVLIGEDAHRLARVLDRLLLDGELLGIDADRGKLVLDLLKRGEHGLPIIGDALPYRWRARHRPARRSARR